MNASTQGRDAVVKIMGVHLGGANTHKTAVVRASVSLKRILSGLVEGAAHQQFADSLKEYFPLLPVIPKTPQTSRRAGSSPLLWEAFSSDIGASSYCDTDSRFVEAVADLGGADIIAINAPLSLPPCVLCPLPCPGTQKCIVPEVVAMRDEWYIQKKTDRKNRLPQPYIDRLFEVHARNIAGGSDVLGKFEFEAVLGSGRAPLTGRAVRLARELSTRFPKALVIETNAHASALGWAVTAQFPTQRSDIFKSGSESRYARQAFFSALEKSHLALRSASLHETLYHDITATVENFYAAMGALSAWGLLNGEAYLTPEISNLQVAFPLRGWPCLPKDISQYAWSE